MSAESHPALRSFTQFLVTTIGVCAVWRASYAVGGLSLAHVIRTICVGALLDGLLAAIVGGVVIVACKRRTWLAIVAAALAGAMFLTVLFVRLVDGVYFLYAGTHIDIIALRHARGEAAGMELDTPGYVYLICGVVGMALLLGLLIAIGIRARAFGESPRRGGVFARTLVVLGLLGLPCLALSWIGDAAPAQRYRLSLLDDLPTWIVLDRIRQIADMDVMTGEIRFPLDPGVRRKLRNFGVEVDDSREYPLVKPRVFEQPFPFENSEHHIAKPNVIVLFLESFSAAFTSVYNAEQFPGLTPNLEDFAKRSRVIEEFYNSTTPTMMSVTCAYCSYVPVTNTTTWDSIENGGGKTRVRCLPHILRERGYRAVHLHQLPNTFVGTGKAMARIGFDEVLDESFIGKTLGEDMKSGWGYSDDQLIRCLVGLLRGMEKQEKPFLLSSATFDSHAPFHEVAGQFYGDGESPLLNSIHGADRAFGEFWDYFKTSPFADNTIVVLLADHAMMPGPESARLRPGEDIVGKRHYDKNLFAIYDPMHRGMIGRSRIVSGSVDVTPTILHMLGISTRNHFEGHSVFEGRTLFPEILGMNEYMFATYQTVGGEYVLHNFKMEQIEKIYDPAKFEPGSKPLNEHEFLHYYKWKKAIHANNLVWPSR